MSLERDWLWDKKISIEKAKAVLKRSDDRHFLSLAAALLSRKNTPKEVFKYYLKPIVFVQNWQRIKRQMRLDSWNDPRIEYWQAIYEAVRDKHIKKGREFKKEAGAVAVKDDFCKFIASKIKLVRRQKGFTQSALARKLKVSQQVISRIENGGENISLGTFKRVADALGATIDVNIY